MSDLFMLRRRPGFVAPLLIVAFVAATGSLFAGETTDRVRARILRMTEFFDTMLPGTLEENNITLHFSPKFSDFRDQEYVRYPFEVRYGLNDQWELSAGMTPFGPNPFDTGRDHRWGPGEAKAGVRYNVGKSLNFFDETTLGLEMRVPIGKPPTELNDHYTHVKPAIAVSRTLRIWPSTTLYANVSYDRSVMLTHRGSPPPDVMRRNTIDFAPGLLFRPSELAYFAEYRFRHISEELEWHLAHELRFGTIWDVPLERTEKWRFPGKWQVELAYKVGHEEGLRTYQGVFARVNWRTSLREVLNAPKARP